MRELLFRGFHPCDGPDTIMVDGKRVTGKWVEGNLVYVQNEADFMCGAYIMPRLNSAQLDPERKNFMLGGFLEVLSPTVGQYTGLTDKNGKRIFEGDILQTETDYFGNHKINKEPVLWNDDIENDSFGEPFTSGYIIHGGNWEIIGTVFDEEEID